MDQRLLGDYRLTEMLAEHPGHRIWLAEQASVGRSVVLIELTDLDGRDSFLADIRAKAAVDHPLIGSVYEAVSTASHCFAAFERLPGVTLARRAASRHPLLPLECAHLLRRVADAMLHLETRGVASEALSLSSIHLDEQGVVRLENPALAGEPDPSAASRDVQYLGEFVPPLVAAGEPGATRLLTVLAWMRGEGIEQPLDWVQVRAYASQVEDQLTESPAFAGPGTAPVAHRKSRVGVIMVAIAALTLVAAVALFLLEREPAPPPKPTPVLPPPVAIRAGEHPSPDGGVVSLSAFRIAACEVTIGEYAEFLETLELLDAGQRGVYDLPGQPGSKSSHVPEDWEALFAAARTGGSWQGRPVDLFCPVVNIDWWDASAYCKWKGGRLPTQEEWFAALVAGDGRPELLQPASWGPVTATDPADRTSHGLFAMAGSVAEWMHQPAVNPANPLGAARHVIIGGYHLAPASGALTCEWTDDLLQRRADLGFRIVFPGD